MENESIKLFFYVIVCDKMKTNEYLNDLLGHLAGVTIKNSAEIFIRLADTDELWLFKSHG